MPRVQAPGSSNAVEIEAAIPGWRWREFGAAFVVTLALAAMVFRAGTFHHGATAASQVIGALLLLAFAWVGRRWFVDPLALGAAGGRWAPSLLGLLWLSAAASWLASPVSRAGEAVVIFLLPAAWAAVGIGRLLGSPIGRRWALAGCAIVAVSASAWALALQPLHEQGRAALPIGHHNQLALVLVALLPPSVLGAWRLTGPGRPRLSLGSALLVGAILIWTLAATGSMSGLLALVLQAVGVAAWMLWRSGGSRWVGRVAVLLALFAGLALAASWAGSQLQIPGPMERLGAVLRLEDPSLLSRRTYAVAAYDGFAERPILGWGPGATSWTLAHHWRPAPGVHPPGEVVTDAHSLLAQAPYELGLAGSLLLLAVAARYGWLRIGELAQVRHGSRGEEVAGSDVLTDTQDNRSLGDPALVAAGLLGLLGAGVCLAFGVFAVVTAVPAVLILNLGLVSAARGLEPPPAPVAAGWPWPRAQVIVWCWLAAALTWSLERAWAAGSYERAVASTIAQGDALDEASDETNAGALDLLRESVALDPNFPLYNLRLDPWAAAAAADGLAPLWLLAGVDESVDVDRRREALERACDLDPLSALAPFELMRLERGEGAAATDPLVAERAARAIVAEPLLLAAAAFEGDPDLRAEVQRRIQSWPGLPPGWLAAFEELWILIDWSNGREGPPLDVLSIDADGRPAVSLSLFAFRRPPWPFAIGAVPLRSHRLEAVAGYGLPAVTRLPETAPEPFWVGRCGLSGVQLP